MARWPQAVTTHLWSYALSHVCSIDNRLPNDKTGVLPLELFSSIAVKPRLKTFHTFGCSIFTLDSRLQNDQSVPKFHPRYRIGLYLGNSPRHARSVSLVLTMDTVRVYPQFHVRHDEFFETVAKTEDQLPWKVVVRFTDYKNTSPKKHTLRQILPKFSFSKIPNISLPPIHNDDFDFQFESQSISNEIHSVPTSADGGNTIE